MAETIKNAANYVSESVKEGASAVSKEGNKEVAKDSNAGLGDRASAGVSAVGDKLDQTGHSASATGHKEAAKH